VLTHPHCHMLPTGSTWIRRYHTVPWAARPIQNIGWIPRDLGFGDTSKRSKIDMLTRKIRKQKQAINCPSWQRPISRKKQQTYILFDCRAQLGTELISGSWPMETSLEMGPLELKAIFHLQLSTFKKTKWYLLWLEFWHCNIKWSCWSLKLETKQ